MEAWANPERARCSVPAKIKSFAFAPLKFFASLSPNIQRIASVILDFPEPLGPTMAVMPSGKSIVILEAKELKP